MKCKHENADHLFPGQWFIDMDGNPISDVLCEQFRCLDCRAWLSLGPANDAGCEVEIRAAELAAEWDDVGDWNGFESLGMISPEAEHAPLIEWGIAEFRKGPRDLTDYYAGHLARVIHDHGGAE